jgi:hypothetical protein
MQSERCLPDTALEIDNRHLDGHACDPQESSYTITLKPGSVPSVAMFSVPVQVQSTSTPPTLVPPTQEMQWPAGTDAGCSRSQR